MTAADIVDAHFQLLITKCDERGRPTTLSRDDRIIYYVIATRCEMDMNGFSSLFDQLLTHSELLFLIDSLDALGEQELAGSFRDAEQRLREAGFFDDGAMSLWDLDDKESETGFLEDIEQRVRKGDRLWGLDEKLVALVPS